MRQDHFEGLLPRWHINFNITMLRIVSFHLDYHWRHSGSGSTNTSVRRFVCLVKRECANGQTPDDHRKRVSTSHSDDEYSLLNFIAYCLYPPLYIAGPIMTFNDFIWQVSP